MSDTMHKTLKERIEENGLRMTATPIETNPPAWAKNMDGWRCTFRMHDRSMTVTFWMGYGHQRRKPEAAEVLECLLSDAAITENCRDAGEFQSEMGYESRREADQTWAALGRQTQRLHRFLADDYAAWLWETEEP